LRETRHIMTDALASNKTEAASRRTAS
jgi:hypothetical protein